MTDTDNSQNNNKSNSNKKGKFPPPQKPNIQVWLIIVLLTLFVGISFLSGNNSTKKISLQRFREMAMSHDVKEITIVNKDYVEVTLKENALKNKKYKEALEDRGMFAAEGGPHFYFNILSAETFKDELNDIQKSFGEEEKIPYSVEQRSDISSFLLNWGILILLLVGFWFLMRRMTTGGSGGQLFNIGKSKYSLFDKENKVNVTFNDVAGLDEAKEEVQEIVQFLKAPEKFTKLGGKIPKGALLLGEPGTGKTLLAKAVAGEAGVPFFSLSGSDFVEMFVGVGAARVRDLFKQAKEKAPCIIFIDEIDAIGRSRGQKQMPGSNDERENTLNSLLAEMDGFATDSGIIILGATNRPGILDTALLRPGRFDRQISIDKPDMKGRKDIFHVHLKPLTLAEDVDDQKLAAQTPGFAGAEIANICNEAALIAARRNKEKVDMQDFQYAIDRVIGGLEKKNKIISPEEKEIVAYHEAGHAVAGWFLEYADPLVKVTIVPRGVASLGYAQYLPKEQFLYTTEQLFDEMCMALGGRAAEEIIFGKISTGALSDLERITKMAYSIVTVYGMNKKIGNISYYDSKQEQDYSFKKPYSEATAETIDEEVRDIVSKAYERTRKLLTEKKEELRIVAKELLSKEIIYQTDLEGLIGKRPFDNMTTFEKYTKDSPENLAGNGVDKEIPPNGENSDASDPSEQDSDDKIQPGEDTTTSSSDSDTSKTSSENN